VNALRIASVNGRVRFSVHVQPRASRSEIVGLHGGALKVRVAAPPVDGAANEALVDFFSSLFAVGRRAVRILAGTHSRSKIVEIEGINERAVQALLNDTER
jgi:uncharacterized protein (TIGR00251 family)